ncbi:hypothetical protein G7Z17_g2750 [Cylindrodendrum hubeiense]|uniref:Uncharacterized protein n=1 Tax=Cylindrodendrum hubeiense TaxID=595255 RepID=A0A9P5HFX0_9HYPO|nr:hypothetical protein G7Z17_g2750 [Cylindrodendrum hubeiense]
MVGRRLRPDRRSTGSCSGASSGSSGRRGRLRRLDEALLGGVDVLGHQLAGVRGLAVTGQRAAQLGAQVLERVAGVLGDVLDDQGQVLEQVDGPDLGGRLGHDVPGPHAHGAVDAARGARAAHLEVGPVGVGDAERVRGRAVGAGRRAAAAWASGGEVWMGAWRRGASGERRLPRSHKGARGAACVRQLSHSIRRIVVSRPVRVNLRRRREESVAASSCPNRGLDPCWRAEAETRGCEPHDEIAFCACIWSSTRSHVRSRDAAPAPLPAVMIP